MKGDPRITMRGEANSAQCHQQLPILGIKHTGAQELGYRPQVVERKVIDPSWPGSQQPSQSY